MNYNVLCAGAVMGNLPDYYAILQLNPNADASVIDAAYRKLAAKHHPDVSSSPDATLKMKQLNDAYEVLSDPARRNAYDAAKSKSVGNKAPSERSWRGIVNVLVVVLLVLVVAKLKVFGLVFLALAVIIWALSKMGK